MGCSGSKEVGLSQVDLALADAARAEERHFKVLMLGAGESGKTTFCRQLKLINRQPMSSRETGTYANAIRQNLIESMKLLLEARDKLDIPLQSDELSAAMLEIQNLSSDGVDELTVKIGESIKRLWNDPSIQKVWEQRSAYYILDAAPYYFNNVDRIASDSYEPSEEDIIMSRVRTTGISQVALEEPPFRFSVVDVGGQRNERKKWIHCFDDVKSILFVTSLAGVSQVCFEDASRNRIHESLELFEKTVGNPAFSSLPTVFLILNKKDLFEDLSKTSNLKDCFPDYQGPESETQAKIAFIESKYREALARAAPEKKLVLHVIAARVRMDVKHAWADISSTIKNLYAKKEDMKLVTPLASSGHITLPNTG